MRIYTRGGDHGKTTLVGGERRYKDDLRVEAYGTIDEAGAFLGLAASQLDPERDADIVQVLLDVQHLLWDAGADLAVPATAGHVFRTAEDAAEQLEPLIDHYQAQTPPLERFILRGGTPAAAALHIACTVVRRAERCVVALMHREEIHMPALRLLNRLSDLLFVLARAVNARTGQADIPYVRSPRVFR